MHKMTRAGVQRNLEHHVNMAEYYYALHEAEQAKKAEHEEALQEETEQPKTTDERRSSSRSRQSRTTSDEPEQTQDESAEQESEQQAEVEEPKTDNHKLLLLHTEVVKQLRDLLDSEPVTHAVNDAREKVPRRNKGPLVHPTSPRLQ